MREIVPSPFGIHSRPSGPRAPSAGPLPTLTVATIASSTGSMRVTVLAASSETQTPSACGSTQSSLECPTGMFVTWFVAGSMREMSLRVLRADPDRARAGADAGRGCPPVWIVFTILFVFGLMRETVPSV